MDGSASKSSCVLGRPVLKEINENNPMCKEELIEDENLSLNELVESMYSNSPSTETFSTPKPSTSTSSFSGLSSRRASKRTLQQTLYEAVLLQVHKKLHTEKPDDEFEIIGKNMAMKLKKLPATTKTVAEKLIMDILYQAELGNLTTSSSITINTVTEPPNTNV